MPKRPKKDSNQLAKAIIDLATSDERGKFRTTIAVVRKKIKKKKSKK